MSQADSERTTSRRRFLKGAGAIAITAPQVGAMADAPIFDLEPAFKDVYARFEIAFDAYSRSEDAYFAWKHANEPCGDQKEWQRRAEQVMRATGLREAEAHHAELTSDLSEMYEQIAAIPARTLDGLIAKARMGGEAPEVIDSIIDDLRAMDKRRAA